MEPITTFIFTAAALRVAKRLFSTSGQPKSTITVKTVEVERPPSNIITFAGATGVGKSSTINALADDKILKVGPEHGTTINTHDVNYKAGYCLRDTPGLMDETDFSPIIWPSLRKSKLVIYVGTGQLYGPEIKIIEEIYQNQMRWNRLSSLDNRRKLILYINKVDTKKCMDNLSYKREIEAIKNQVKNWIPEHMIAFGSASPVEDGIRQAAQISGLKQLIDDCCSIHE